MHDLKIRRRDITMDALNMIKERRSVRRFKDQPVEKETIEKIVELASYAPSWKNTQTTRYIAVMDHEVKKKIVDEAVMGFEGNMRTISGAPVLIVETTVDKRSGFERDGSFSTTKETHWQSFDAGIACQTFCLAAYEEGLATVIMGIFEEDKVKEIIDVPEGQSVSVLIAMGYADEEPKMPPRKSVEDLLTIK